jgi:hypothetical protein
MISIKIYRQGNDILVGACDARLIGKTFVDGKFQIAVSPKFYDGERVDRETLKKYLRNATIANLVGRETVACAVQMGLIDPSCIMRINGVPHAQMVKMI